MSAPPITALIADDEPHLRDYLQTRLARLWPQLQIVATAGNGVEALQQIRQWQPDIVFLDIKMPGLTGLQVAQQAENCHCVFVTAYDQYALRAFEQAAVDYLLKPVDEERLAQTVQRLQARLAVRAPAPEWSRLLGQLRQMAGQAQPEYLRWLRAGVGNEIRLIAVDDVCYFQASEKYTAIVTAAGEYLIRTPLKELAEQLDPQQFWQIHRATLVNVREIAGAQRELTGTLTLRLQSRPETLRVSRAYTHLFRQM